MSLYFLILILNFLNFLDVITTHVGLTFGAVELNPINTPTLTNLIIKIALPVIFFFISKVTHNKIVLLFLRISVSTLIILIFVVVLNNGWIIWQLLNK